MKYFRIGDLAKICEVNIKTIRFYEDKDLLSPVFVDRYTNYRYYDGSSVQRLFEIIMFKDLGFSLKEIKTMDISLMDNKITSLKQQIKKAQKNISKLEQMIGKGENMNDCFVNDENVIGKWKRVNEGLPYEEIYFLPEGKPYWVFSWTKGYLLICQTKHRYEIKDNKMYIYVKDINGVEDICSIYEKVDNNIYSINDIKTIDNLEYEFTLDTNVLGNWKAIDFVSEINIDLIKQDKDLYLKRIVFCKDGTLISESHQNEITNRYTWTKTEENKGMIIDKRCDKTASQYIIVNKNNKDYMFFEWKSGDYIFGKLKPKYYVLVKE